MIRRKAVIGLSVLCALAFCAVAAASASAKGTTVFTCSKSATTKSFHDAHCTETSGTLEYGHIAVPAGESTELKVEGTTSQVLKGSISGVSVELSATTVELKPETMGTIVNTDHGTEPMDFSGKGTFTYTGVKVLKPSGKGCVVKEEMVSTEPLTFTSIVGEGATKTGVEFTPAAGKGQPFAEITIEKCSTTSLNGTFSLKGSLVGTPHGATLNFTEASTAGLTIGGNAATLNGSTTVLGRKSTDSSYTPLSVTTTEP